MTLSPIESTFKTWDGTELFYRSWIPASPFDKALVLFHRGHEHSNRLAHLVNALALDGMAVFAWDARGNGRSPGRRDWAENFMAYEKDVAAFIRHLRKTHGIAEENIAVLGHSVGAALLAAWAHDFAPRIRAMVLATPAFRIRLYVPLAIPSLRAFYAAGFMKTVPSYVKARVLTHDPVERKRIDEDPLITHSISTNILLDLYDTSTRVMQDAAAIRTPTLLLTAGKDYVVQHDAEESFFQKLGSDVKQKEHYPEMFHAVFHETGRQAVIERTKKFLQEVFAKPFEIPLLVDADKSGYTKREYDELSKSPTPAKALYYGFSKQSMNTLGRLSQGIRLGYESGFNSGRTLDYVYENQARGKTPIGKVIDWFYLNSIGWKGIRVRRQMLERLLRQTIQKVHAAQGSVHLVDIAAGAGRYMLEVLRSLKDTRVTATLRDREPKNLEQGRTIAQEFGVQGITFIQGDAFNGADLASLSPKPQVAVVSGLYELFPDNGMIRESLRGLAAAVEDGGYLVYTNQPWHPQVELIARTLCNWDGKPWVMRRRTQAEMDDLIREAGFEKEEMDVDPWGIFTVSVARRINK